jgi:hypothetical protein
VTDLSNFREHYTDAARADTFANIMAELDDGLDAYELTENDVALILDGVWGSIMSRRPAPLAYECDARRVLA